MVGGKRKVCKNSSTFYASLDTRNTHRKEAHFPLNVIVVVVGSRSRLETLNKVKTCNLAALQQSATKCTKLETRRTN